MKKKTILLFANPLFYRRCKSGITQLYQIFCLKYHYNLKIVTLDFLKEFIPDEEYSQILAIAGGDGTINRVINTIPDEAFNKYIFGIIPAGTANELAKALNIPLNVKKAAELAMNPKKLYYQHLALVNKKHKFATGMMYGIGSKVLEFTPVRAKYIIGTLAFYFGFILLYLRYWQPWDGFMREFKINSRKFRTNLLLINNASLVSKGLKKDDIQDENKNLFSIIYIHSRLNLVTITKIIMEYFVNRLRLHDPALHYEQIERINLEFEGDLECMLDGDFYILESPVNIEFFDYPMAVISG